MSDALDSILAARDLVSVLTRTVEVRMVEISASGALLESPRRLEPGLIGRLRTQFDGEEYADDVRIVRCVVCPGSSGQFLIGIHFLWTSTPGDRALRRVVVHLRASSIESSSLALKQH